MENKDVKQNNDTPKATVKRGVHGIHAVKYGYEAGAENNEKNNKDGKKRDKKSKLKKAIIIVLSVLLGLVLLLVAAFFILFEVGKSRFEPAVINPLNIEVSDSNAVAYDEGKTVKYKGKKYVYNEDIVPVAFMGIDTIELGTEQNFSGDVGQSDANMVIAFDTVSGRVDMIVIPRDTMTDISVYDKNGNYVGLENMQLCLSYAYGDGKEKSCEMTLSCIEHILCGIDISAYVSLDLSGIGELNDAIGGVTLVSLETVADFTEGVEYYLTGELARNYVQRRDTETFNSDSLRRERQLQYAKAFANKTFAAAKEDFSVISRLYEVSGKYMCTNLDLPAVTYLATCVLSADNVSFENIHVLKGDAVMGEHYMEVDIDETYALETVLEVFYKEVS